MKKQLIAVAALSGLLGMVPTAQAENALLTGDNRLACEALLCLKAPGARPSECDKAIAKFTAIKVFNPLGVILWPQTNQARDNFLSLCPASQDQQSSAQQYQVAEPPKGNGDQCSADGLNAALTQYNADGSKTISNSLPSYCGTSVATLYQGKPEQGGHWVDQQ